MSESTQLGLQVNKVGLEIAGVPYALFPGLSDAERERLDARADVLRNAAAAWSSESSPYALGPLDGDHGQSGYMSVEHLRLVIETALPLPAQIVELAAIHGDDSDIAVELRVLREDMETLTGILTVPLTTVASLRI